MKKLFIKADNPAELLEIPNIHYIFELCHISNTLKSSVRALRKVDDMPDDNPSVTRDRFYSVINITAFTFEGMNRTLSILNKISFKPSENLKSEYAWLLMNEKNKKSYLNKVLGEIRNKYGFHFTPFVNENIVRKGIDKYPPLFTKGKTEQSIDTVYPIVDELIGHNMVNLGGLDGTFDEKFIKLFDKLVEFTMRFYVLIDEVIAELTLDYISSYNDSV